ncbi:MAG: hypothetical protein AAGG45_10955 [Pseudomonadota bacterium]
MGLSQRRILQGLILGGLCTTIGFAQAQIKSFQSKDNEETRVGLTLNGETVFSNLRRIQRETNFDADGVSVIREVYVGADPDEASESIQSNMIATAKSLCQSEIDYAFSNDVRQSADGELRYELEFTCG